MVVFGAALLKGDIGRLSHTNDVAEWVAGAILTFLYFALFEWLYGATVGKAILRMRVVRPSGEPCGLASALVRGLWRYIDGLFFGLVAYASMKPFLYQRLGDKAANTVVAHASDPYIQHRRPVWGFFAAAILYVAIDTLGLSAYLLWILTSS
jgi:uncharacterized RDD family membrane protein YckC